MIKISNKLTQERQIICIADYYAHKIVAPQSWAKAVFIDVCQIIGGSQPPKEYFINEPQDGYIRLIQIRDYKTDKFATYIPIELAKRFCNKDDIMIGRYGPPIFQILRGLEGAYNVALMKAIPNVQLLDKEFLYYFLQTPNLFNYVAAASLRTAGQDGVRKEHLDNYPLFIPPLNEQRRIVAKIEALKARSQRVKEELEDIPQLLDQFRQSVLAAAFRGDLTADWREQNSNVEPASVLLERIRAERRRRWEESELEKMKASGKTPKDDKWKEKYKEPNSPNISDLPIVPENWTWSYVEEFADVGTGATPLRSENKYYEEGTVPWVTSGALNSLFVTEAEEYITPIAIKKTNAKVFPKHTLLVAMYGEGKTRGKVSELLIDAATNQACAALIIDGVASAIRPIVKLFFQKNYNDLRRLASGGVQPNLNLSMIKATLVTLPPLKEQEEIIQRVNSCMSIADAVEKEYFENVNLIKSLDQSILAKAFRGELVPQDLNDEPASVLLERIRAERDKLQTKTAKKSTTKTSARHTKNTQPQVEESVQLELGLE